MEHISRNFRMVFGNIATFHIINGAHKIVHEPPYPFILERGFKPPFYSWAQIGQWRKNEITGEFQRIATNEVFGLEQSVQVVIETINEHGPFDGVLSFSQGSIFFRHFYRIVTEIDPQSFEGLQLPKFIVSIGGPYFPTMMVNYKDRQFDQTSFKIPIESVHFIGLKDQYLKFLSESQLYTKNPLIIKHDETHTFPKRLSNEDFEQLKEFLRR